ncbi:putative COP9 signalosome complex subunit 3 protein [Septoria linicola]|nr:putative COP9 signalosome complex subunit 3 protein [Septoria linicola]
MADLLPVLLSFPPEKSATTPKTYDKAIHDFIKSLGDIKDVAYTKNVDKDNVLDQLDPAVNSIAYLRTLVRQILATKDPKRVATLEEQAAVFFGTFDPVQIRYAGDEFVILWDWMYGTLYENGQTDLTPLVNALLRLDPTAGTFIPAHLKLVRLCLLRSVPSQALPVLDADVHAFPSKTQKATEELPGDEHEMSNAWITDKSGFAKRLDCADVLEYYLVGASIYIGLQNWTRARLFLEYILLSPSQSHTASALQVEAYKKWILVGLIAQGKPFPDPKTHDQIVWKAIKALSKPYDELALDFTQRNGKKFQANAETAFQIIQDDGNIGLVKEVSNALQRYRVIDLQRTYAALPVVRIANLLEIDAGEALQTLQSMIQGGYLAASLSGAGADTVLRFHDTATSQTQDDLEAQTTRIQALVTQVREADRRLQLTKEFVEHQKRNHRSELSIDPADAMDLTWEAPGGNMIEGDDEDLML